MKLTDARTIEMESLAVAESQWDESLSGPMTHVTYHEMADRPVVEVDALSALENNLALLENLQGRLSFLMREVSYLLKA